MTSNITRCLCLLENQVMSMFYAAPKLALVPENRYNCDVNNSFLIYVPSFIRIERGLDGGP